MCRIVHFNRNMRKSPVFSIYFGSNDKYSSTLEVHSSVTKGASDICLFL